MLYKIAIVASEFNKHISDKLLEGALNQLLQCGVPKENINIVHVPGAVEIPLVAKIFAHSKKYAAIICLGAVIRGETGHYDYVCQQVSQGCQRVMLDYDIPVIFGVLTTDSDEQALARVGGTEGHKGIDAANAAIAMVQLMRSLHNMLV